MVGSKVPSKLVHSLTICNSLVALVFGVCMCVLTAVTNDELE